MFAIDATLDRETAKRAGAEGTFQVTYLDDDEGNDLTYLAEQGRHFRDMDELRTAILQAIADRLNGRRTRMSRSSYKVLGTDIALKNVGRGSS